MTAALRDSLKTIFSPRAAAAAHRSAWIHRQPLVLLAAAAASGILLDALLAPPKELWLALFVVTLALILRGPKSLRWMAAAGICLPLFAVRHSLDETAYRAASIFSAASTTPQPAIVEGTVDQAVRLKRHPLAELRVRRGRSPWQTQFECELARIRRGLHFEAASGRAVVMIDGRRDDLRPGDMVRLYGELSRFAPPSNPGAVDFRKVYRQRGVQVRLDVDSKDQVTVVDRAAVRPQRWIASLAAGSRELLLGHLGESTAPLALALVLGQRDFIDPPTHDALLTTGTVHLLSVSGMHLAIVAMIAHWTATCLRFPQVTKIVWVIGVCLLYTALTGGRPPVVRAAVLVTLVLWSIWIRRPSQSLNTLALAALLLMFFNPELIFGVGAQLSFLAVTTLLVCGGRSGAALSDPADLAIARERRLEQLIAESRGTLARYLRFGAEAAGRAIWYSGCVTAVTLPLVWHQFHVVSLISVAVNVLLMPLLFLALASGILAVVLGWFFDPLAVVPAAVCHVVLLVMRAAIDAAVAVPAGHHWLPSPPTVWVIVFYGVLVASMMWPAGRLASRLRYGWIALWAASAWWMATTPAPLGDSTLEATFVDVGHGTSVVLRLSEDEVWLYDCGRLGNELGSSRHIDTTLWSLGVTHLRGIILSHADADHYNALPGVLARFTAERIVTPPRMLEQHERGLSAARRAIAGAGVPVQEICRGEAIESTGPVIEVLHPPAERLAGSDNANSLVVEIDSGSAPLVLPGDLEPPGVEALIRQRRPRAGGVLMAPHHGSLQTDSEAVLQWARPRETVVSGSQRAARVEVRDALAVTGSGVHVTSEIGAVRVRLSRSGQSEVRSWLRSPW